MGILNKFMAFFSVSSEKVIENSGLSGFQNEVNLRVTQNDLVKLKSEAVEFKVLIRTKQKKLDDINVDINDFSIKLNSMSNFCKKEDSSEDDISRVKTEARKVFNRMEEKEKLKEALILEIKELEDYDTKISSEIAHFEKSLLDGKDSIKNQISKQNIANSKIRLSESAEKLIGDQKDISSSIQSQTAKKEAEAEIRFDQVFGKNDDEKSQKEVEDIINSKESENRFNTFFN